MNISGKECARARESVSADLDCELQELDLRRLQVHLSVCADCATWAGRVRATTAQLREAPAERSAAAVFDLPRRDRKWRVAPALVVAPVSALAALAAGVVLSFGATQHGLFAGHRTTRTSDGTDRYFVHNAPTVDMYRLPPLHYVFRAV
jgi:predicted anti-sigma-YlaC factor YlaD